MSDNTVREAAQALIDRWDTPLWKDAPATAEYINALRRALAEVSTPDRAALAAEAKRLADEHVTESIRAARFSPHAIVAATARLKLHAAIDELAALGATPAPAASEVEQMAKDYANAAIDWHSADGIDEATETLGKMDAAMLRLRAGIAALASPAAVVAVPRFNRTHALMLLSAASKSGDPGAIALAAQLAGAAACPTCDYVHFACKCETAPQAPAGAQGEAEDAARYRMWRKAHANANGIDANPLLMKLAGCWDEGSVDAAFDDARAHSAAGVQAKGGA